MLCFIPIKSVVCREKTEYKEWSLYPLKRTITGMQDEGETLYGDLMSFSDWKSLNLKFNDGNTHHDMFTDMNNKYVLTVTGINKSYTVTDKNGTVIYTDNNVLSISQLCISINIAKSHIFIVKYNHSSSDYPVLVPVKFIAPTYNIIKVEQQRVLDTYNDLIIFDKNKKYKAGNVVKYDGNIYVCVKNTENVPEEFNQDTWKLATIPSLYNEKTKYVVGDLINYSGIIYVCIKDTIDNITNSEYWAKLDFLIDYMSAGCCVKITENKSMYLKYTIPNVGTTYDNIYNIKLIKESSLYEPLNHANIAGLDMYKVIAVDMEEKRLSGLISDDYKIKISNISKSLNQYYLPCYRDGETNNNRPMYEPWTIYYPDYIIPKDLPDEPEYKIPLFDLSPNWD